MPGPLDGQQNGQPQQRAILKRSECGRVHPRLTKFVTHERLRQYVQDRLSGVVLDREGRKPLGPKWNDKNKPRRGDRRWVQAWSPEQIAHRLPADFPDDDYMRISHEAIYQALYVDSRGALKRELVYCLDSSDRRNDRAYEASCKSATVAVRSVGVSSPGSCVVAH